MLPVHLGPLPERLVEPGVLTRFTRLGAARRAARFSLSRGAAGLLGLWLLLWGGMSHAAADELFAGVEPRSRMEGVDLVLNGAGLREILFFDIYVAALYLPHRLSDPNAVLRADLPRRLRINLLRDMDAERDLERLLGGMKDNNSPEELAAIHDQVQYFLRLIRAMGKVEKGSVILLDYLPEAGTRVWFNQHLLGTVPGEAFNRCVLKIWLGERPIQKSLKKALLGEARVPG